MAFSFSANLGTPLSRVRQLIGDTNADTALVQDETINAYLARLGEGPTAAQLAHDIAAQMARKVTTAHDHQQTVYSDLYKHYTALAERLTRQAGGGAASVGTFNGIEVTGIGDCRGPLEDDCECT